MTTRTQINAKLDPVLFHKLSDYCNRERVDKSSIVRIALRSFLDNTSDVAEIKRDVSGMAKDVAKNTDQIERLIETLATIVERRE
jgi:hypothetical protein